MAAVEQARYAAKKKAEDPDAWRKNRTEINRRYRENHRLASVAHSRVHRAVERGDLIRSETCQRCGKLCKTEASHDDYTKPLEVEWLCRQCHAAKDLRH